MADSPQAGIILCSKDAGANWQDFQYELLARTLAERISGRVVIARSPDDGELIAQKIEALAKFGVTQLTFLPLSLLPLNPRGIISHSVRWALQQWPDLGFRIGPPLGWDDLSGWIQSSVISMLKGSGQKPETTALILCGPGLDAPLLNADLSRLEHLLCERCPFHRVSAAFLNMVRPAFPAVLSSIAREPVQDIIVIPWQLSAKEFDELRHLCPETSELNGKRVHLFELDLCQTTLVNLLVANVLAATPLEEIHSTEFVAPSSSALLTEEEQFDLHQLRQRIDAMLPSEYLGRYETVSPRSMGTAPLQVGEDGRIAWDQIWTSFCDLALAGGPPHRGKLLEAITAEEALSDPDAYRAVVDEIQRGVQLVTRLKVFDSPVPGWVGIQCDSEEMAAWLMRAIIVENVMVRREGVNLFLPAGPRFTVAKEIKNVITTIAKTVHYWSAHLKSGQRPF